MQNSRAPKRGMSQNPARQKIKRARAQLPSCRYLFVPVGAGLAATISVHAHAREIANRGFEAGPDPVTQILHRGRAKVINFIEKTLVTRIARFFHAFLENRSIERRMGKECVNKFRSRGAP